MWNSIVRSSTCKLVMDSSLSRKAFICFLLLQWRQQMRLLNLFCMWEETFSSLDTICHFRSHSHSSVWKKIKKNNLYGENTCSSWQFWGLRGLVHYHLCLIIVWPIYIQCKKRKIHIQWLIYIWELFVWKMIVKLERDEVIRM